MFGLFGSKDGGLSKHAKRVANKRAQEVDRWESIRALGEFKSAEAVEALLARFGFTTDPGIRDQQEKELVVNSIISNGDAAVAPLRKYLQTSSSIAWPVKCLESLIDTDAVTTEFITVLDSMDTLYERDPEKKIQLLAALEDRPDDRVPDAIMRFLEDANETARFHTVATLFEQPSGKTDAVREALTKAYLTEESVRVRVSILAGFIRHEWTAFDVGQLEALRAKLPRDYRIDDDGNLSKS